MSVLRITRFTADPAQVDQLLARRAELIAAIRASYHGLIETRLARIDDETWIDEWRWESAATFQAATDGAPNMPEAAAAFALTTNPTAELAELVDER